MTPSDAGRQPWLHELAVCVYGNVTALSDSVGDICSASGQGVYVDDRRAMSELSVVVSGERPSAVTHAALGAVAEFFASARNLGEQSPDPTIEVRRRRELSGCAMSERVMLVSRATETMDAQLVVRVGSDAAPVASIKAGVFDGPALTPRLTSGGATFQSPWHRYDVGFTPEPESVSREDNVLVVTYRVTVPPAGSVSILLSLAATRRGTSGFDADAGAALVPWHHVRVTATDPRVEPAVTASLTDLRALLLTDPEAPGDVFAAAGTPWYLTLFGRDSLWAARLTLPLGTELAAGTLHALARRQGRRTDPLSGEAPGKILHEVRRFPHVDASGGTSLPPVYFGTVDATSLWVVLLHEAWCWGLPQAEVDALVGSLDAAVAWIMGAGSSQEDGLLKYLDAGGKGLSNQGWKDSDDAMRFRDGRIATGPIALLEAQAYAVQALECAARLYDELRPDAAAPVREYAGALREVVATRYWTGPADASYLGLALDGDGVVIDGLGSNMAHVLGTGVLDAAQAARVAAVLSGPELLDRYGVRTLGTANGGFNPIGYHTGSIWTHDTAIAALGLSREGLLPEAVKVARCLLAAAEAFGYRWPELYSGEATLWRPAPYPASCRPQAWSAASAVVLLSVALGLRPDRATRTLHVHPVRPAPFGAMTVQGLSFAGSRVDLDLAEDGNVVVRRAPEGAQVEVH